MGRKNITSVVLICTLFLSPLFALDTTSAKNQDTQTLVNLAIKGGFGYTLIVDNTQGSSPATVHYTAFAEGIFRNDAVRDIQGEFTIPSGVIYDETTYPIFCAHPFVIITVTMNCEGQSISKTGLQLFSNFFIFF